MRVQYSRGQRVTAAQTGHLYEAEQMPHGGLRALQQKVEGLEESSGHSGAGRALLAVRIERLRAHEVCSELECGPQQRPEGAEGCVCLRLLGSSECGGEREQKQRGKRRRSGEHVARAHEQREERSERRRELMPQRLAARVARCTPEVPESSENTGLRTLQPMRVARRRRVRAARGDSRNAREE